MIAAIYARKSTAQRGVDDEAKSVALQIQNARTFAAEQGWTVDDAHVYVDDAVSGSDLRKLKARQRLLDIIKRGAPFQTLIIREQSRFSRRDGDEAFGELKQIARAGVVVWFYKDRAPFAFGSFGDNIVGFVRAEAAADYRRQIAGWVHDAMVRKARAGHVAGGRLFGYDNVRIDGHVERRINEAEADVVREVFRRAAAGDGLKTIAKALNAENAPSPRPQRSRPPGWSPSSVREVLHRDLYRGVAVWNKTKKRDASGEQRQHARPKSEWVTVAAEPLRLISDAVWRAVHDRLHARKASALAAPPLVSGRGIRRQYLLAGFGRCVHCGGAMQVVSRASSAGRIYRLVCATYWNRGAAVCRNGLMADMIVTDAAVREKLAAEVLQPRIVSRAVDLVVATIQHEQGDASPVSRLERQLKGLDVELANLAETAARGGAVPVVLEALARRDAERRRIEAELVAVKRSTGSPVQPAAIRARLRGFLDSWHDHLLTENPAEARGVLDTVLADRIVFIPDVAHRRYALRIPIAFDRVLAAVVPELRMGLQDTVASPTGFEPVFWP
jgi:site-specific DNA recombinase